MPLPAPTPRVFPAFGNADGSNLLPPLVASGGVNVYEREQFHARSLTFGRRDYYKVALLTGTSRYNYASRGVFIDRPALVFSNPLIPYSWERVSEEQGGYLHVYGGVSHRE